MKRCSSKVVDLVELGRLRTQPGWHNNGYIFPDGFIVHTIFRSSVRPSFKFYRHCANLLLTASMKKLGEWCFCIFSN